MNSPTGGMSFFSFLLRVIKNHLPQTRPSKLTDWGSLLLFRCPLFLCSNTYIYTKKDHITIQSICILTKPLVFPTNRLLLPSFPKLAAGNPVPFSLLLFKCKSGDVFRHLIHAGFHPLLSLH